MVELLTMSKGLAGLGLSQGTRFGKAHFKGP